MTDEYSADDDYIVTQVAISHVSGFIRVTTYGPYTRNHAARVRRHYEAHPPRGNWTYKYHLTKMQRDRVEAA